MKQVILITEANSSCEEWVTTVLASENAYSVHRVGRKELLQSAVFLNREYHCIVFDCEWLDQTELQFLSFLASSTRQCPVIILAGQITIYSYSQVDQMKNMVALQSPCDSKIFSTVLGKMVEQEEYKPDTCPRFITQEPVRLIVLKTGLYIPTVMRNYSAGGAFLEYRGISLKVGDHIQLNLGSARANAKKEYLVMNAKVVWIRDGDNARSPARGVGVQFLPLVN